MDVVFPHDDCCVCFVVLPVVCFSGPHRDPLHLGSVVVHNVYTDTTIVDSRYESNFHTTMVNSQFFPCVSVLSDHMDHLHCVTHHLSFYVIPTADPF